MALAVGFAVSEGKLSLADRLCDCFPEAVPDGAPPALLRVTLRDLLTMSSGFGRPYLMIAGGVRARARRTTCATCSRAR